MIKDTSNYSVYELSKITRKISSWPKIAAMMYKTKDPEVIKKLLFAELRVHSRPYNAKRLYQRFNRLRCDAELMDIATFIKDVPVDQDLLKPLTNQHLLAIYLKDVDVTKDLYKRLIAAEASTKNRSYLIKLLYGKYQILRRAEEMKYHGIGK